jgi:hypothetical protein
VVDKIGLAAGVLVAVAGTPAVVTSVSSSTSAASIAVTCFGGSRQIGSSPAGDGPSGESANEMLWAMNRFAPAAHAAASKIRVPSVRSRLVGSNSRAIWRGGRCAGIAVSW